jgi:hypothetical protein
MSWGEKFESGTVRDQPWFCMQVAATNKLEFLKWAREEKDCEWDERTIKVAAHEGNLEMLKYCFSKDCPYDEKQACKQAAIEGHLDCLLFLFAKVQPSRDTEKEVALQAASYSRINILKYLVEERKISDGVKNECMYDAAANGRLVCLKYLVEGAKAPLDNWQDIACARYYEHPDCENYLLEKGRRIRLVCRESRKSRCARKSSSFLRTVDGSKERKKERDTCVLYFGPKVVFLHFPKKERNSSFLSHFERSNFPKTHMSRIDYSKWDKLNYSSSSSSSEEDDDEGEKEAGSTRGALPLENLSLSSSSSPIWNGLVLHHKDVFVSHVLPKLNQTDRFFFGMVNTESQGVLKYAGLDVSVLKWAVHECSSISTLELKWNHMPWGEKDRGGEVMDQAWFLLASSYNEQTRVPQVGNRSETLRVG